MLETLPQNDPEFKKLIKEKQVYINDLELTKILIKEINNRKYIIEQTKEKVPGPSNQLGEWFVKVTDHMLTRGNFRGYSDNYKDEFKSNAYLFFARYWWKFDPTRVAGNKIKPPKDAELKSDGKYYISENNTEIEWKQLYKPESEWKGGFTFFTTLAWTGTLGALKTLKEADNFKQKMAEDMTKTSKIDTMTEYYVDRSYVEGY